MPRDWCHTRYLAVSESRAEQSKRSAINLGIKSAVPAIGLFSGLIMSVMSIIGAKGAWMTNIDTCVHPSFAYSYSCILVALCVSNMPRCLKKVEIFMYEPFPNGLPVSWKVKIEKENGKAIMHFASLAAWPASHMSAPSLKPVYDSPHRACRPHPHR